MPLRAGGEAAETTRAVLGHVFDGLLRLLHPIMPFVTEELYSALSGQGMLATASWPVPVGDRVDAAATAQIGNLQQIVTELRRFRQAQGLQPRQKVPAVLVAGPELAGFVEELGVLTDLRVEVAAEVPAGWPALDSGSARVGLDLSEAIDVDAEIARIDKLLAAADKELAQVTAKLGNASFVDKAPAAVVEKMRQRQVDAGAEIERLRRQRDALAAR